MTAVEESSSSSAIDAAFCNDAIDELAEIFESRDIRFASLFELRIGKAEDSSPHPFAREAFRSRFLLVARIFCVALSLLGIAVCLLTLALDDREGVQRLMTWLIPVFVAVGFFCWFYLPALSERLYRRTAALRDSIRARSARELTAGNSHSLESNRRTAGKVLQMSTALVPYEAHYALNGSTLLASRVKDGQSTIAWKRDLLDYRSKGLGVSGSYVTAIFKRRWSLMPAACVLHRDASWIRAVLQRADIPLKILHEGD